MVPDSDAATQTAREFGERFLDESFDTAADLLTDEGRDAVEAAAPEGFPGGTDAEGVLEEFWYGLYGQYGAVEGVGEVETDRAGDATEATEPAEETEATDATEATEATGTGGTESGATATVELRFADGTHPLEVGVEDGAVTDFALPSEYEPPSYADADAFAEREVTVDSGDVELDGVLAVPGGDGPFPGVVLVHGAGIHDPDGTAANSKILRDFAWGLASQGVAVLRYEKRLRDHEVDPGKFTLDTVVVDDAVAAVDELAAADEVAGDGLFVAGHSQGGMAAPRVADRHGGVAGVASLDGTPETGIDPDDLSLPLLRYTIDPEGDLSEEQEAQLDARREEFRRVAEGDYEPDEEVLGKPGRWQDSVRTYDPAGTAEDLDAPAFVAKAGRADPDVQPEIAEFHERRLEEWRGFDLGDGSRVEFYGNVGHYFQEGHEPTSMTHLHFADNVADYVVADLAEWVHDVAGD